MITDAIAEESTIIFRFNDNFTEGVKAEIIYDVDNLNQLASPTKLREIIEILKPYRTAFSTLILYRGKGTDIVLHSTVNLGPLSKVICKKLSKLNPSMHYTVSYYEPENLHH